MTRILGRKVKKKSDKDAVKIIYIYVHRVYFYFWHNVKEIFYTHTTIFSNDMLCRISHKYKKLHTGY